MKKLLLSLVILLSFISIKAQVININPDKKAEPWNVGGLRLPSNAELDLIPILTLPSNYKANAKSIPSTLDNSTNSFFRPVFNQSHGSCAQAGGIGYTFTYEMNYMRGTDANIPANQYPTHYTYNFLNEGSGDNGSWYMDGWNIIKANGCPNIPTYGGLAASATYWMSGYSNYESSMNNRVKDYFGIYVNTPEGLETLKYWLLDHLDGSNTGGIVNFAAGATGEFLKINNKIVEWGHEVNHAMTIVGWDDAIEYDYSGDGNITNHIDINSDGIVDMKDWEKGALIMVNSWGTGWGNQGKAYMMYKTLAEHSGDGGIYSGLVYGIHVKEAQTPQLLLKVKMTHNSRDKIKIIPGISTDLTAEHPDYTIYQPIFRSQGGDFDMRGNSNSNPIEISMDISPLLSHIETNETAKIFLVLQEVDQHNEVSGEVLDFSIIDSEGNEYTCSSHNVQLNNNGFTFLSINATPIFEFPTIETTSLPLGQVGNYYSHQLMAVGGSTPYSWKVIQEYSEESHNDNYPNINSTKLTPTNNDDGYVGQQLNFDFPFYGDTFNEIYVSTDGSISFLPEFNYIRNEEAIIESNVISVFAHDLIIDNSNHGIFYEGDANSATFRWKMASFNDANANIDVAVTLFPDGKIEYYYGDNLTTGLSWASGISNGKGSNRIASISGENDPSNTKLAMIMEDYPIGLTIDENGNFEGITNIEGTWNINFVVSDNNLVSDTKTLIFSNTSLSVTEIGNQNFSLYPNPVNEELHINYSLPEKSHINIALYDLSGRLVCTILDEIKTTGTHTLNWNSDLKAGMYFYKITSDSYVQSGKLIFQ